MLIERKDVISAQLAATEELVYTSGDGRTTELSPQRFVPAPDGEAKTLSLNGTWKMLKWPFPVSEEELLMSDNSGWECVEQPGKVFYDNPEICPSSIPNWNRVTLEHIDMDDGAMICREIAVPADWKDKMIFLRFDAVFPAARYYCNGKLVGKHLSGLTPFEKDITSLVKPGEIAKIAVRLIRCHKHVQLDMPRHALEFCGISQDCRLFAVDKVHVADYHLVSGLDAGLENGSVCGEVKVRNASEKDTDCELRVSVKDSNCEIRGNFKASCHIKAGTTENIAVTVEIPSPMLWNDEFPNLHDVTLELFSGDVVSSTSYKTGFRRFELVGERPVLNGNPVKFRGVNHLTFHPEHGMYTPKEWLRNCLGMMKKANVNAIRTHFSGPPALLELCDELGIYLLQEIPIDWGHTFVHEVDFLGPAMMRVEGIVRRDRHHPCVMVWSIGNENMPRNMQEFDDFMNHLGIFNDLAKSLDPGRPTMFPPPGPANKIEGIFETRLGDVADTHYSFKLVKKFNETGSFESPMTWDGDMQTFTRSEALANGWSGVWFSSEYGISDFKPDLLNAPYVSIIADKFEDPLSGKNTLQVFIDRMKDEWDYMRKDPTCLGGAYFPWLCAGSGNNPWGWVRFGEDADWGIMTADLTPKPVFWALRSLFSPLRFPACLGWDKDASNVEFSIYNMYNAINLRDCTFRVMINSGGNYMTMMRDWKDFKFPCPPGESVKISIPLFNEGAKKGLDEGNIALLRIFVLDPKGFRVTTADILLVPENIKRQDGVLPIGPDAIM